MANDTVITLQCSWCCREEEGLLATGKLPTANPSAHLSLSASLFWLPSCSQHLCRNNLGLWFELSLTWNLSSKCPRQVAEVLLSGKIRPGRSCDTSCGCNLLIRYMLTSHSCNSWMFHLPSAALLLRHTGPSWRRLYTEPTANLWAWTWLGSICQLFTSSDSEHFDLWVFKGQTTQLQGHHLSSNYRCTDCVQRMALKNPQSRWQIQTECMNGATVEVRGSDTECTCQRKGFIRFATDAMFVSQLTV